MRKINEARQLGFALLTLVALIGCGGPLATHERSMETAERVNRPFVVTLRFEPVEPQAAGEAPRTRVTLIGISPDASALQQELGVEAGACTLSRSTESLLRAQCWWGPRSVEYVVRRETERLVAVRQSLQAESPETTEVIHIDIRSDVEVQVLQTR